LLTIFYQKYIHIQISFIDILINMFIILLKQIGLNA